MAAVAVPQHLATSRVSQAAAGARTHLGLTHFSLQLLLSFLHSARLTLALSIVNEHIDFEVSHYCTTHCIIDSLLLHHIPALPDQYALICSTYALLYQVSIQ